MSEGMSSSHGGSSRGSSAVSQTETQGAKLFYYMESFPLFPLLQEIRISWHPHVEFAVKVVEAVQLLAFCINSIEDRAGLNWGPTMDIATKVIYFSHFPIWDHTFVSSNRKIACMIAFWIFFIAISVTGVILSLVMRDKGKGQVPHKVVSFMTQSMALLGSIAFVPVAGMMLSFMVCTDVDGVRTLRSYPDEECWGAWHVIHFCCGVIALFVTVLCAYIRNVLLYDISPFHSVVDLGRPHSKFDEMFLFLRLAIVVFFHIAISNAESGVLTAFSIFFTCACVGCALYLSFALPFYNLVVTRVHVAVFVMLAWNGLLALCKPFWGSGFVDDSYSTIAFCAGSPLFFGIGYYVSDYRVSEVEKSFRRIMTTGDFGKLTELSNNAKWPLYLPEADMDLCRCSSHAEGRDGGSDTEHASESATEQHTQNDSANSLEVIGAYIDSIFLPTDIEVATRVLRSYVLGCQFQCTNAMLTFAIRLYTKGIVKFPNNSDIHLNLIVHLAYYEGGVGLGNHSVVKIRAALAEAELLLSNEASIANLYHAYLLQLQLKPLIGLTNDSHRKVVATALKTYKDILSQMAVFWNKLLVSENVDTVQLAVIVNSVTGRRGEAMDMFRKALRHPTYSIVRKYAQFLRHVMIDEDSAHAIEQKLVHMQREERSTSARSQSTNIANYHTAFSGDIEGSQNKTGNSGIEGLQESQKGSSTIRRLSTSMTAMFALLILILIGCFMVEASLSDSRKKLIDQVAASGRVRALALQCAVLVQELVSGNQDVVAVAEELRVRAEDFLTLHQKLTHGSLQSSQQDQKDLYSKNSVEMMDQFRFDDNSGIGSSDRTLAPLWVLGNQFGAALLKFVDYYLNKDAQTTLRQPDADFIMNNALTRLSPALHQSIKYYHDAHEDNEKTFLWIISALFAVSLLLLFFIYLTMAVNFQKVGSLKLDILNLFTYIPHVHVKNLAQEARTRIASCEDERESEYGDLLGGEESEGETRHSENNSKLAKSEKDNTDEKEGDVKSTNEAVPLSPGSKAESVVSNSDTNEADDTQSREVHPEIEETKAQDDKTRKVADNTESSAFAAFIQDMDWMAFTFFTSGSLLTMATLALILLTVALIDAVDTNTASFHEKDQSHSLVQEYARTIDETSYFAQVYQATGEEFYLQRFWQDVRENKLERSHTSLVLRSDNAQQKALYLKAATLVDNLRRLQFIGVNLATSVFYTSGEAADAQMSTLNFASDMKWNESRAAGDVFVHRGEPMTTPASPLTNNVADLKKSVSEKQTILRTAVLYSNVYQHDMDAVKNVLSESLSATRPSIESSESFFVSVIATSAVQIVLLVVFTLSVRGHEVLGKLQSLKIFIFFYLVLSIVTIVTVSKTKSSVDSSKTTSDEHSQLLEIENATRTFVSASGVFVNAYVQSGDPEYIKKYLEAVNNKEIDRVLHQSLQLEEGGVDLEEFAECLEYLTLVREIEKVSLSLAVRVFHPNSSAANNTINWQQFTDFRYDIRNQGRLYGEQLALKESYENMVTRQGSNAHAVKVPLLYTSTEEDMKKSDAGILELARDTAAGVAHEKFRFAAEKKFMHIFRRLSMELLRNLDDVEKESQTLLIATLSTQIAGLGAVILFVVYYLLQLLNLSESSKSVFFPNLMTKCRLSLSTLTLLLSICYGISFYNRELTRDIVEQGDIFSRREHKIASSMFLIGALRGEDGKGGGLTRHKQFEIKSNLVKILDEIVQNSHDVSGIVGHASKVDSLSYGVTAKGAATSMIPGEAQAQCTAGGATSFLSSLSAVGVEMGVLHWLDIVSEINAMLDMKGAFSTADGNSTSKRFALLTKNLFAEESKLFDQAMQASVVHNDHASDTIANSSLLIFLLLGILAFSATALYVLVFRSMVVVLKNEEEGTKLMLTMIPQEVRETAPAIAEYLSTGVITLNDKIEEANEWIVEFSAIPAIVIDQMGMVQRFSRAAREVFGLEAAEILGKNIKMIMPNEYASKHDEYLATYRKTGVRHIIGNQGRRIRALQKNGSEFHARVCVNELKKTGKDSLYVGTVQSIMNDLRVERQLLMGEAIVRCSQTPIIMCDTRGMVINLSNTAFEIFAIKLGSNVKEITPENIRSEHDGYIKRYLDSGVKNIIGKDINVDAVVAGGNKHSTEENNTIQISLRVSEFRDESGVVEGFVGYLQDLTEDNNIQYQVAISESIMKVSPNPVVSIDQGGIITRWNRQAEVSFGWSRDDAIGMNIKCCMTPDIAQHHDGYLAKYLRTGEKKMINQTRRVSAVNASGEFIRCEVNIREIGNEYIAYIRETKQEEDLMEEVELQQSNMDKTPSAVVIINEKGIIQQVNKAAETMFGFSDSSEMVKADISTLMPDEIARKHSSYLARYLETGKKYILNAHREVPGKRHDGVLLHLEVYVMEVILDNGRLYVGTLTDITERKNLARQNSVNTLIIKMLHSPIMTTNEIGCILSFNSAAENLFGWGPDIVGKNVSLLQPDSVAAKHDSYLQAYQKTGKKSIIDSPRVVKAKRKNASLFAAEILVKEILIPGSKSTFMASFRDTTGDRKRFDFQQRIEWITNNDQFMFISINTFGKVLIFNRCCQRTLQYSESDILEKNVKVVLPDEIARNHDQFLRTYARTGIKRVIGTTMTNFMKRKDESHIPVEVTVREIKQGQISTFVAFITDKLAVHAAELNSTLKDILIERCPTPLITTDTFGTILTWPRSAEGDTQFLASEAIGKNIKIIQLPKVAKAHDGYLKAYRKTKVAAVMNSYREVTVRRKDKSCYQAVLSLKEAENELGEMIYVGALQSIETKMMMQKKEQQSQLLLDLAMGGFVAMTTEGIVTLWASSSSEYWGYSKEEVLGENVKILMPEPTRSRHDGYLENYKKTQVKNVIDTTRHLWAEKKDGSQLYISLAVKVLDIFF